MKASITTRSLGQWRSCSASAAVMRDRLLAQHVLAGLGRLQGQRHVQMVGQRIVDRIDARGRRAAPHRSRRPWGCRAAGRGRLRALQVARGDGDDLGMGRALDAGDHLLHADIGGRDDAPAQLCDWLERPLLIDSLPECDARRRPSRRPALWLPTMPQMHRGRQAPEPGRKTAQFGVPRAGARRRACRLAPPSLLSGRLRRGHAFRAERCRSGRSGRSRKPLYPCGYRGFESHPLRQKIRIFPIKSKH